MKKVSLDNDQIFSALIASEAAIYEQLTALVGEDAKKAVKTIRQHAVVSATCGLAVVVPGADLLAFVANTWTMYARINKALGISLSKNILKSIATAVGTNVVSIIPGMAIGSLAGSLMKAFPGLGTLGGMAVSGTTYYAISTVMGWIYLKGITILVSSNQALDAENLKAATKQVAKDKEFVKNIYESAKEDYKNKKQDLVVNVTEVSDPTTNTQKAKSDIHVILQLAKDNGGSVSLADCIIATGNSVEEVKKTLGILCDGEVMVIDNDRETGSIIYKLI